MANKLKGKVAIIGIGEVPTGKYPNRSPLEAALDSARQAIFDAGIRKDQIDVVLPTACFSDRWFNTDLAFSLLVEELGLTGTVRQNTYVLSGGSTGTSQFKTAAALINAGMAQAVLCVHTEQLGTGLPVQEVLNMFATFGIPAEWEAPYGQHFSSVAALVMNKYMYDTGTTPAEMASVCVSNRKWAELNPHAMFRKPLTVDQVLNSKMLSEPLHALESNMLADGASAFIVASAELAQAVTPTPVYFLGEGSRVTHYSLSQEKDLTRFGYREAAQQAFAEAGVTPGDIDIAEIYDSYAIFQIIALEECGFCDRGSAGKFVYEGNTWPGGKLPMTTNGGMLSQGHTGAGGGVAVLVETARQLMGKAGERQVPGAKFALETATGGTYMDIHVSIFGREVE